MNDLSPTDTGIFPVISNGYMALQCKDDRTHYAGASIWWPKTPSADIIVKIKFVLKEVGTGTDIRLATRVKARATGEDASTAFDSTTYVAVPVTTSPIGKVFEASMTLSASLFAVGDAVAFQIGRDGTNILTGGPATTDSFDKHIQIIAIDLEIP